MRESKPIDRDALHAFALLGARERIRALDAERASIIEQFPALAPRRNRKATDASVLFDAGERAPKARRKPRRYTPEQKADMVARVAAGEKVDAVARAHDVSHSVLREWCDKAGVAYSSKAPDAPADSIAWIKTHKPDRRWHYNELAKPFGISEAASEARTRLLANRKLARGIGSGMYELTSAADAYERRKGSEPRIPRSNGAHKPGVHVAPEIRAKGLAMVRAGKPKGEIVDALGVADATVHRWRKKIEKEKRHSKGNG